MTRILLPLCLCFALCFSASAQDKAPVQREDAKAPTKRVGAKATKPVAKRPDVRTSPQKRKAPAVRKAPATRKVAPATRTVGMGSSIPQAPPLYSMDTLTQADPPKGSALSRILKNQLLRVCVRADIPPFGHFTRSALRGFDVQLAREIGTQLSIYYKKNLRVSWAVINAGSRINSLLQNNCDMVIATFSITKARAQLISFSRAYLQTHKVILKKVKVTRKKPIIALVRGTTTSGQKIDGSVRFFRNYTEIIDAMERAEVDYAVTDQPIAAHMLRSVPQPYTIQRVLSQKERYGVGVNRSNKALLGAINRSLLDLARSGRLAFLQRQWL